MDSLVSTGSTVGGERKRKLIWSARCSEIGSVTSLNAPELHASSDVRAGTNFTAPGCIVHGGGGGGSGWEEPLPPLGHKGSLNRPKNV